MSPFSPYADCELKPSLAENAVNTLACRQDAAQPRVTAGSVFPPPLVADWNCCAKLTPSTSRVLLLRKAQIQNLKYGSYRMYDTLRVQKSIGWGVCKEVNIFS